MNIEDQPLDDLVRSFAARWGHLGEPRVGEELLADPVLVLGGQGATPVGRADFLKAVAGRTQAVSASSPSTTELTSASAQALGEQMVVATITWTFRHAGTAVPLVGDFLLHREASGSLRCVAYLPRTNVLDHLPESGER